MPLLCCEKYQTKENQFMAHIICFNALFYVDWTSDEYINCLSVEVVFHTTNGTRLMLCNCIDSFDTTKFLKSNPGVFNDITICKYAKKQIMSVNMDPRYGEGKFVICEEENIELNSIVQNHVLYEFT